MSKDFESYKLQNSWIHLMLKRKKGQWYVQGFLVITVASNQKLDIIVLCLDVKHWSFVLTGK